MHYCTRYYGPPPVIPLISNTYGLCKIFTTMLLHNSPWCPPTTDPFHRLWPPWKKSCGRPCGPTLLHRMVKVSCRKCWLQFKKYICVIYYNIRHTIVPYSRLWPEGVVQSAHYWRRFGDLFRWLLHPRLYAECSPYFYCRFVWNKSIPHASTPASIIPTKFKVDITIHCELSS